MKKELAKRRPNYRLSYSRGGFVTFKLPENESLEKRLAINTGSLRLVFARSCVHSLGSVLKKDALAPDGSFDARLAAERVWRLAQTEFGPDSQSAREAQRAGRTPEKIARIHVFERDRFNVGVRGFEPGLTPAAYAVHRAVYEAAQEDEWRVGMHRVSDVHSRYPGGLFPLELPTDAASRAFLKFEEGLRWADFPIGVGSRCVDVGSAPGGGSQALLARGAEVLGVDPAEMDPRVLANPNFTHLRGKVSQLKRKLFRKSRWFITDMNVAPKYTLDALEELVARDDIAARGLLFTLKFFEWNLADNIPEYISRIKSWGFNHVKARQLQFNRQEIMIAALKKPFVR